jgi:hypothetical protein
MERIQPLPMGLKAGQMEEALLADRSLAVKTVLEAQK